MLLQELERKKQPNHYFPSFYGEFLGPHIENDKNTLVHLTETSPEENTDFQLIYKSNSIHKSLVTLTFTADTVSFVDNKYAVHIDTSLVFMVIL